MKVRHAKIEEVSLVRGWIVSTAEWLRSIDIPQWERFLVYNMTEVCLKDYKQKKLYVLQGDNESIVGSLSYGGAEEIDKKLWMDCNNAVFVHRIVIDSQYRGMKNGEYLLNWAREKAYSDSKELRLHCAEGNKYLYNYYNKLGFKYCGCNLGYHLFKV